MSDELTRLKPTKAICFFRRVAMIVVALAYVLVGILHHTGCEHSFAVSGSTIVSASGFFDGKGSKFALAACDHCPSCATGLAPDTAKVSHIMKPEAMIVTNASMPMLPVAAPDIPPPKLST